MTKKNIREKLMKLAKTAMKQSYSPYSKFPVGAAVLTTDGKIFTGCNVENSSFGLTICAERVAIFKAISNGSKTITKIAITAKKMDVAPCGACRQVISEFGKNIEVIYKINGKEIIESITDLLPNGFYGEVLK